MANTPRIRFKGFTDDWEQRKLGEVIKVCNGRDYKHLDVGKIPVYGTGGYMLSVSEALSYKDDSIGIGRKGTIDRPYILKAPFWTVDTLFYCIPKQNNDLKFIFSIFQNVDWKSMDESTGVPSLSKAAINKVNILTPNILEQVKIGTYFSALDHLITLHQRKCDETKKLKKYMLQKMFPKNGEKNPEIRFAGFTNDWEQRKLGEVCERINRKNKENESDLPLTISSQHGLIDQRDFFNKVVAAKDMSEYYLLQKGEFAYNKSYSNGYDYGSIKRLNSYEKGCLSTLYICFKLISDKVNSDYLECYFDTLGWYHNVSQICAEGARNHGLLNVDVKAFFTEVTVKFPVDVKEQQQISAILHYLDHLITLHQRKCDNLKLVKKFMLQNMFPQKG